MGARRIYHRSSPYTAEELPDVGFEESQDVVYLAHVDHAPHKLVRYSDTSWLLEAVTFGTRTVTPTGLVVIANRNASPSGWRPVHHFYAVTAVDATTGSESLVSAVVQTDDENDLAIPTNSNTLTWDAVTNAEYYNAYKFVNGTFGFIGSSDDAEFVDEYIDPDYSITPPRERTPFNAANKYPGCVTFFEQRTVWGRTLEKPAAIFGSRSSEFENMNVTRPLQANDAYTFSMVGRQKNIIRHLLPMKELIVLTDTSVKALSGTDGFITPTSINIDNSGYRGSSKVRPVLLDENLAMFVPQKGGGIRTLGFQFEADGYKGNDITVYARHLFKGFDIVQMAWAEHPTGTLWCVRSDGKLCALTWLAEQEVWGWTLCETDGLVESCAVVLEGGLDTLYIAVARQIGGETRRMVERLTSPLWSEADGGDGIDDACFLDSAIRYSGEPANTFEGLTHLEGREVYAVADGSVHGPLTVANGRVGLPAGYEASRVVVGLPYDAWLWTLKMVQQLQGSGSTKTRTQGASAVTVSVIDSRNFEVAPARLIRGDTPASPTEIVEGGEFYEVNLRDDLETPGEAPPVRSGDYEAGLPPSDWRGGASVVIRQPNPLPLTVIGVTLEGQIGG